MTNVLLGSKTGKKTGLLGFDDKNGDGNINYTSDAATNELKVDNDIMVLANPEIAKLPNWVIALVAAGGLAAALSTAAGSIAGDFVRDFPRLNQRGN